MRAMYNDFTYSCHILEFSRTVYRSSQFVFCCCFVMQRWKPAIKKNVFRMGYLVVLSFATQPILA